MPSEDFIYLRRKITQNKLGQDGRIFVVPPIKQIFEDQALNTELNATERTAWEAFENVCRNILGNEKAANYSKLLQQLISLYSAVG
jgi:uncharacterized protein (DUF2344 family)